VLTVAFAYFFLGEKLTKKALAGLAMIVAGTLMLLM
jgi:drug/metabolite transporter (DMT)-like permease